MQAHVAEFVCDRKALSVTGNAAVSERSTHPDDWTSVNEHRHSQVLSQFVIHWQYKASEAFGRASHVGNGAVGWHIGRLADFTGEIIDLTIIAEVPREHWQAFG
ncbi:hypothetical protein BKG85_04740 [Mycobacteroides chelonae]|nr:hypothetical protein BKG85_04740 [Mycobacteroides chelonae]